MRMLCLNYSKVRLAAYFSGTHAIVSKSQKPSHHVSLQPHPSCDADTRSEIVTYPSLWLHFSLCHRPVFSWFRQNLVSLLGVALDKSFM